jgi:hypothetical protein
LRAIAANFRLIQRLFTQIVRIRDINQLNSITKEVVQAARETLLIGSYRAKYRREIHANTVENYSDSPCRRANP